MTRYHLYAIASAIFIGDCVSTASYGQFGGTRIPSYSRARQMERNGDRSHQGANRNRRRIDVAPGQGEVAPGQEEPSQTQQMQKPPEPNGPGVSWDKIIPQALGILSNASGQSNGQQQPTKPPIRVILSNPQPNTTFDPVFVRPPRPVTVNYPPVHFPPVQSTSFVVPPNDRPVVHKNPLPPMNTAPPRNVAPPAPLALNSLPAAMHSFRAASEQDKSAAEEYIKNQANSKNNELEKLLGGKNDLTDEVKAKLASGESLGPDFVNQVETKFNKKAEDEKQAAQANLDDLTKAAGSDPAAAKIIADAKDAVSKGQPLPKNFDTQIEAALKAAGKTPADIAKAKVLATAAASSAQQSVDTQAAKGQAIKLAKEVVDAVDANAAMSSALAGGSSNTSIPTGPATIVVVPALDSGTITTLGNGVLLTGSGGSGSVHVTTGDPAELLGVPLGVGEPVPDAEGDLSEPLADCVLLRNPAENSAAVRYVIDSKWNYTLQSDFSQQLDGATPRQIRFSRGTGATQASYTLSPGTYAFGPNDKGWELFRQSFRVTIDNSAGDQKFHYVVNNQRLSVEAGGTKTHTADYPIVLRFNRGDAGSDTSKRITQAQAQLIVAVNPADGLWDLFPADADANEADARAIAAPAAAPKQPQRESNLAKALRTN